MSDNGKSIQDLFSNITEPRDTNKRHKLLDIITIALCAIICGCDGWEQIEEFGKAKREWFRKFLDLPYGIPGHDTFRRVFAAINPDEFQKSFIDWMEAIQIITEGEIIAIDGKTLRRSHDKSSNKKAIHMVSAWASENSMVLGQVKTEEKSNEITAIPKLLNLLDIKGCIVTIDAMGCQKDIAGQIIDQGGDYVLSLKGNQGRLHEEIKFFFEDALEDNFKGINYSYHETVDGDHGRIETRRYWSISDLDWLTDKGMWKALSTVVMVERTREINDESSSEISFYISSMDNKPENLANAIRSHWGIENSLHWVLDISFREDESRIRQKNAPENMAVLRHFALNLLKKESSKKRSIKMKRLRAGWDEQYLTQILHCKI
jgi:predicted transposase YbfD/YdcC